MLSINSLREDLQVAHATVSKWIKILENLYLVCRISPFGVPKVRAVKKEQKLYFYNWAFAEDNGARFENLVATHLLNWMLTDEVVRETGLSGERIWSAKKFGNLGGASIIFSLAESIESKRFKSGDQILLMSVGGGLSYACQLWECTTSTD